MRLLTMIITFLCAIIACFIVNVFAPNGQTAFQLVSRFPVPISPAAIVLYFWCIVYGALAYWLFIHVKQRIQIPTLSVILFNLAMVAHALTFFSWQQQLFSMSVVFAFLAPLLLLLMYTTFYAHRQAMRIPLSLCISFFSCLFIWEAAFVITYIEWGGFGLSEQLWGVLLVTLVLACGIFIRYRYDDPYFLIAYIWLYFCIILQHHIDNIFISSVALFLGITACLAMKYMKK